MSLSEILSIILAFLIMVVMVLAVVYLYISYKNKQTQSPNNDNLSSGTKVNKKEKQKTNSYTKIPVFDFMQFDKIEDNMIVQDGGSKYLMVVECEGVNYDLMSSMEKAAVEAGFVQFLNSLRYTIQIYTQTRTVNIEESILNYREKLNEISKNLESKKRKQTLMLQEGIATRKTNRRLKKRNSKTSKFI